MLGLRIGGGRPQDLGGDLMSLHVECLLLEVETAALEEAYRSYEACRLAGDTSGTLEQLVRVLVTASRILDLSEAVLRQATT